MAPTCIHFSHTFTFMSFSTALLLVRLISMERLFLGTAIHMMPSRMPTPGGCCSALCCSSSRYSSCWSLGPFKASAGARKTTKQHICQRGKKSHLPPWTVYSHSPIWCPLMQNTHPNVCQTLQIVEASLQGEAMNVSGSAIKPQNSSLRVFLCVCMTAWDVSMDVTQLTVIETSWRHPCAPINTLPDGYCSLSASWS